ncbi:DUF3581 family protein [Cognaticolwellia beringensis]|uniref:DUF3581 domain-containing protein n=1 Tax=Cognaticolwellia beringensis TaxID=1967665 RepID=A0A222G334_9GAMM|nr:DUF3581 family protein [Cognaticolwellia beringensis]ASP46346.1 DUF3581 domain-containing protein [Cognaticolwellia beringensis]
MFLENYCQITDDQISFTRQQASDFAKQIADDFNPLHNIDAKRFCVPGDLLFSLILERAGLHQEMSFKFSGMVTDSTKLNIPTEITTVASIVDDNQKEYLNMSVSGDYTKNSNSITALTRAYVEFSGHTFPHILVELMKECQVMINPTRPMIMYESMSIHLDNLDFEDITLRLSSTTLDIDGKRGNACLSFDLVSQDKVIGHGKKFMLLSGLREYCQDTIDNIVTQYNNTKALYIAQK